MDYLDRNGNYSAAQVIEGLAEIEEKIQEESTKEVIDESRLTRLRYEQMLRGLYLWQSPYGQGI